MNISEIGEFGLIKEIEKIITDGTDRSSSTARKLLIGTGDDAAVWMGDSSVQLATTDTLVEDVHFTRWLTSWPDLGWKALAVNLSDIAAMGGLPVYALVSLSLPGTMQVESALDLYRGIQDLAEKTGTIIIGGNITTAPLVTITITVTGTAGGDYRKIMRRAAAQPGDKIAVTGYPGMAAAGRNLLQNSTPGYEDLTLSFLKPFPRIFEGITLADAGVRTAIDISDGLIADLGHICESSFLSAIVYAESVPLHPDMMDVFREKALDLALSGGEDYELLVTAPEAVIKKASEELSCPVTIIGEIEEEKPGQIQVINKEGNEIPVPNRGWNHFDGSK